MRLTIMLTLAAALLGGCGYQLKGSDSPLNTPLSLSITTQGDDLGIEESLSQLAQQLPSADSAVINVSLSNAMVTRRPLSYDSGVTAAQYAVEMVVWVQMADAKGGELASLQPVRVNGVYSYDRNYALAKEHEQRQLEQDLADKLAKQILTQAQMLVSQL
jgi:outer membrane lipopolysaccharide assembly protein LptE/RlpB